MAFDRFTDEGPYVVPDLVKQFVHYFYRHIRERNIPEIQSMYEISWLKLTERYYKLGAWPPVELIADIVDNDHVFCLLYKEMFFRHLYARCAPDLRQRCESWENYCDLFGVMLNSNVNMQLPNIWLWDMIDEFIYQFQSFCQYRGKVRSADEMELIKQCDKVWNVVEVLNILQALVDKSGIVADLTSDGGAKFNQLKGYYPNSSNVLRMLGYFSLVGLLRVHCLIGDYHTGLKALYPINMNDRTNLFTPEIAGCNISLYYYGGFAYLMMRRYIDAARCFNTILMYINRVKQFYARSLQYDQMLKKNEQMYALTAVVLVLCPASQKLLDDNVLGMLKDRNAEKMAKMARGDVNVYDELFSYACPKFITPISQNFDTAPSGSSANQLAYRRQLELFLQEVRSTQVVPLLKQYLILYSSISLSKLATLMDVEPAMLRTSLTALKNKYFNLRWNGEVDATSGVFSSSSDIDFYIDVDLHTGDEMVIVSDSVITRNHADLLARHIGKFEDIIRDLESPPVKVAGQAQTVY